MSVARYADRIVHLRDGQVQRIEIVGERATGVVEDQTANQVTR
jgi:hypothetical protein